MKVHIVSGFDRQTGEKTEIVVRATTIQHARTISLDRMLHPKVREIDLGPAISDEVMKEYTDGLFS